MTVLKLVDDTELQLAATPEQASVVADGSSRTAYKYQVTPSETITAESVNKLVSDTAKTDTLKIVTDCTTVGTYYHYTVLASGVTLINGAIIFTLAKQSDAELQKVALKKAVKGGQMTAELYKQITGEEYA